MFKFLRKIITLLILIGVAVFLLKQFKPEIALFSIFESKPLELTETAQVIEQINKLAEYSSTTYFQETFIIKEKPIPYFFGTTELVITGKVTLRVGYDFDDLKEDAIRIASDTLHIQVPKIKILDSYSNPEDFKIVEASNYWAENEMQAAKIDLINKVKRQAVDDGILQTAEKSAADNLKRLFTAFGFETVNIIPYSSI